MTSSVGARAFAWIAGLVHLVFFIRYALLIPFLLVLIAILGWLDRANPILGNVLLVEDPWELFNLTWITLIAVALSFVEARVALLNAKLRFRDCPQWAVDRTTISAAWLVGWLVAWLLAGLCLPLVCGWATLYGETGESASFGTVVGIYGYSMVAGVVFATLLMLFASVFAKLTQSKNAADAELVPTDLLLRRWPGLRWRDRVDPMFARVLVNYPGYAEVTVVRDNGSETPVYRLRPGHDHLVITLILAILGYMLVFWWAFEPEHASIPVLFYLVQVLIIVGAIFTGASFFLDRYRLPVPIVLLIVWILLGLMSHNDHFFAMRPLEDDAPSPKMLFELVRTWEPGPDNDDSRQLPVGKDGKRTLVVVSAAGGGIQAAAWTTTVLTELHRMYGVPFTRSVRLISGVSGGSVGTMFYLANYSELADPAKQHAAEYTISRINAQSHASSLETSAWGLTFYDLFPALVPVRHYWPGRLNDRGTALEDLWSRRMNLASSDDFTVRGLAKNISKGHPVPIFNCTNGSTGARFLWSPIKLIERENGRICDPEELVSAYPDWDLKVVTAARLSATFSYVSPICRPIHSEADYPLVPFADGGYADNEGILTVVQMLTTLLSHYPEGSTRPPFDRILIIRILPFATAEPSKRTRFDEHNDELHSEIAATAWRRALIGPLDVLTHVRQSSQSERGEFETVQFQAPSVAQVLNWNEWTEELNNKATTADKAKSYPKSFVDTYSIVHDISQALKTGHDDSKSGSSKNGDAANRFEASGKTSPPIQIASVKFVFSLPQSAALSRTGRLLKKESSDDWQDYFTPLSWKLSKRQKEAIKHAWERIAGKKEGAVSPFENAIFIGDNGSKPNLHLDDIFEPVAKNP
jgi:hypothetical protein